MGSRQRHMEVELSTLLGLAVSNTPLACPGLEFESGGPCLNPVQLPQVREVSCGNTQKLCLSPSHPPAVAPPPRPFPTRCQSLESQWGAMGLQLIANRFSELPRCSAKFTGTNVSRNKFHRRAGQLHDI